MAEKKHWTAEPSSYRMSREHKEIWALVYDPTPGGRKNDDGATTYSIRFPALVLSEYVEGPEKVAADLARSLNSRDKLVEALEKLLHAVCGETGFAACVRADSGRAYPWPALDEAEALSRAALASLQTRDGK